MKKGTAEKAACQAGRPGLVSKALKRRRDLSDKMDSGGQCLGLRDA